MIKGMLFNRRALSAMIGPYPSTFCAVETKSMFIHIVWHFCSKKNLSKLERIQERALRFVYRDYKSSYEKLLDQAKLQSLHLGRLRSLATEIHKAVHGGAPPYVSSLFTERESEYSLRRNHSLILPPYNTISFGK